MDWKTLLETEAEEAFHAAERLLEHVDEDMLDWKPDSGDNWMTTGQLLHHMTSACGGAIRGFVTGDWGMPEGVDPNDMPADAMIPPAEAMPAADSLDAVRAGLAEDKKLAFAMIEQANDRMDEPVTAPWDPRPVALGRRSLAMINHLNNHKAQLYYYLKLQGKPVNTMHFYGMA